MNSDRSALLDLESLPLTASPMDALLATPTSNPAGKQHLVRQPQPLAPVVGRIVAVAEVPLVDFAGRPTPEPLPARHTCRVTAADAGREVVLVFENNNYLRPIILGLLQDPAMAESGGEPVNVTLDGDQLTLTAKNEIVLRCGKSSITLTRAGKVLIRGAYVLSRSSGVNRIKGGSVQIN